jgi:hypothetical protein
MPRTVGAATDANKLRASVRQDGPVDNLSIIINFQGQ